MAELKQHPSLPSNYVTLAQLQERWLKEKEEKQKEIEEERQRKERENEEQEIQKQREIRERSEIINKSVSIDRRPIQRNRRNVSEKNRRFREVGVSKSVDAQIEEKQQRKEREKEEQEIQKQREIRERSEIINKSVSIDRRPIQRNSRNGSEKNRRFREVGVSKSVDAQIEEEQQRKVREKEEQERNREDDEKNKKQSEIRERSEIVSNSLSIDRRPIQKNARNRSEKNRQLGEVGVSKTAEAQIEAVIVVGDAIKDQGEKIAELKNKKNQKKKFKGKWGKPRAQENLIEGTAHLPPEKSPEGEIPMDVTERIGENLALNGEGSKNQPEGKEIPVIVTRKNTGRKGEKEGNRRGSSRNERNLTVDRKIWERKTLVDVQTELKFEGLTINGERIGNEEPVMENNGGHGKYNSGYRRYNHPKEFRPVQMEPKFEGLTLNGGTIVNEESMMESNGGDWKNNSGYRRYNHQKERMPRECSLVWVKKRDF